MILIHNHHAHAHRPPHHTHLLHFSPERRSYASAAPRAPSSLHASHQHPPEVHYNDGDDDGGDDENDDDDGGDDDDDGNDDDDRTDYYK